MNRTPCPKCAGFLVFGRDAVTCLNCGWERLPRTTEPETWAQLMAAPGKDYRGGKYR